MSITNFDPTDLIFTFKNGRVLPNVLRTNNTEDWENICASYGGLEKIEYVAVNGDLIDVGQVVKDNPGVLDVKA